MKTIAQIANEILDTCGIPAGEERECLLCEIAKAIAKERHELNNQVQGYMAEFRMLVEATLLPKGMPEHCDHGDCKDDGTR